MSDDSNLIYPLVNAYEWAKRYKLPIKSELCRGCGKRLVADRPFAAKNGWRGLTSKPHACGSDYDLFLATKASKQERQDLVNTFNQLSAELGGNPPC